MRPLLLRLLLSPALRQLRFIIPISRRLSASWRLRSSCNRAGVRQNRLLLAAYMYVGSAQGSHGSACAAEADSAECPKLRYLPYNAPDWVSLMHLSNSNP